METRLRGAAACFVDVDRPPTPPGLRKYRWTSAPLGRFRAHYGRAGDALPDVRCGLRAPRSEPAATALRGMEEPRGLMRTVVEQKESVYRRPPIGCVPSRGVNLPEWTQEKDFRFGVKSHPNEANPLSEEHLNNTDDLHPPGVCSVNRRYQWDTTPIGDPSTHRFGKMTSHRGAVGVREVLQARPAEIGIPSIISKRVVDVVSRRDRQNRANPRTLRPAGIVNEVEEIGARECLEFSEEAREPDSRVGVISVPPHKSTAPPWAQEDQRKRVPTSREVVAGIDRRNRPVNEDVFTREQLEEMVRTGGVGLTPEEVERVYTDACGPQGSLGGVTLTAFRQSMHRVL